MRPPGRRSEPDLRALEARPRDLPRRRLGIGYLAGDVDRFLADAVEAVRALVEENRALRAGVDPGALRSRGSRPLPGPLDVQGVEFRIGRLGRGYRMRPVDELLDEITDHLNALGAENEALRRDRGRGSGS